jgi:hypothetical protein
MFKIIAIVFIVLIVAILIYAATKPDTFRVQRSISIKAGEDLSAHQRLQQFWRMVTLRKKGPHDEENTQRRSSRQGCRV